VCSMLSHLERAIRALSLEEADRVPLFEQDFSKVIAEKVLGRAPYWGDSFLCLRLASEGKLDEVNEGIYRDLVDITKKVDLDFMGVPGFYSRGSTAPEKIGEETWRIYGRLQKRGGAEGEGETFWDVDKWGVEWTEEKAKGLIDDLNRARRETDFTAGNHKQYRIVREWGDQYFIYGGADGSWGPIVTDPLLMVKVLHWMYRKPSLAHGIIGAYVDLAIESGKAQMDSGVHGMLMCVDYGYKNSTWMSPKHFHEFIEPALRRQCDAWHKRGVWAILHSDGNTNSILNHMVDGGIDAYQCIDVQAGMDLSEVKLRIGERVCLIGNVALQILEKGAPHEVEGEVKRCIRSAANGGGYVLSPSANVSIGTNAANYLHMIKVAKKLGNYPSR
jgi:hypothetical protein